MIIVINNNIHNNNAKRSNLVDNNNQTICKQQITTACHHHHQHYHSSTAATANGNEDQSEMAKLDTSNMCKSAGTWSPKLILTISAITILLAAGTLTSLPLQITRASDNKTMALRASAAFLDCRHDKCQPTHWPLAP
ncbi:hypothetical protein ACA910_010277 [Epithemia clementina (nom. ined.)]